MADLERIIISIRDASREGNVAIVTGDTKVVPRGKGDKIFINTSGIGMVAEQVEISSSRAKVVTPSSFQAPWVIMGSPS